MYISKYISLWKISTYIILIKSEALSASNIFLYPLMRHRKLYIFTVCRITTFRICLIIIHHPVSFVHVSRLPKHFWFAIYIHDTAFGEDRTFPNISRLIYGRIKGLFRFFSTWNGVKYSFRFRRRIGTCCPCENTAWSELMKRLIKARNKLICPFKNNSNLWYTRDTQGSRELNKRGWFKMVGNNLFYI